MVTLIPVESRGEGRRIGGESGVGKKETQHFFNTGCGNFPNWILSTSVNSASGASWRAPSQPSSVLMRVVTHPTCPPESRRCDRP